MISVINGYVCTSSCEAASAKQGMDPSAPPGSPPGTSSKDKTSAFASQPATVLGGALADTNVVSAADNTQQPRLDRLA
ncbi:MAG TPA: hypothetical protein VIV34_13660 [Pseudolabrys sp.]